MNLVKLLSVGQSLKSGKTIFGKYKLTQQSLLPKFGSTVRPAQSDTFVAPNEMAQVSREIASSIVVSEEAKWIAPATTELKPSITPPTIAFEQTQKIPTGKILRRREEAVPRTPKISLAIRLGTNLAHKITFLKKRLWPARSRRKPFVTPIQTEWSLEKVTVMRNDLSEADLEVISPKATDVLQSRKANLPVLNSVQDSGRSWIKKTAGLFNSDSPFESAVADLKQGTIQVEKHAELTGRV